MHKISTYSDTYIFIKEREREKERKSLQKETQTCPIYRHPLN